MPNFKNLIGTDHPLTMLLRGGAVKRYHCEPFEIRQTVAEHTWRLLVIMLYLFPGASPELIRAALYHDTAETVTGDLPAPTKRVAAQGGLIDLENEFHVHTNTNILLTEYDQMRLKVCDYLELCLTMKDRHSLSPDEERVWMNGRAYVKEHAHLLPAEEKQRVLAFLDDYVGGDYPDGYKRFEHPAERSSG